MLRENVTTIAETKRRNRRRVNDVNGSVNGSRRTCIRQDADLIMKCVSGVLAAMTSVSEWEKEGDET